MNVLRVTMALICLVLAGLVPAADAQVQRGSIFGTITDNQGAVLPGATVQLTSDRMASREATTGTRGEFRFADLDPGNYTLKVTLGGFTPYVRENVAVGVGTNVELPVQMLLAGVSEEVRVTAEAPLLDTRSQGNVANFDNKVLNEIPTARDPWVLMQFVPGVQVDRVNVGGSESGQQSVMSARGDDGSNTMWNVDGVTITDPAAIGSSPTYYDYSTFDEVQFTTGGLDPRQQTGGLGINFVTKRGTNDFHGQARLYFTNDSLQGTNVPSELAAQGFRGNGINQIAEYGADVGGPIIRDRLWFWGAWAKNDIQQVAITGRAGQHDAEEHVGESERGTDARRPVQLLLLPRGEGEAGPERGRDAAARDDLEPDGSDQHLQVRGQPHVLARTDAVRAVRLRQRRLLVRAAGRHGGAGMGGLRERSRLARQLLPVRDGPAAVSDQRGWQLVQGRPRGALRVPVPADARELPHAVAGEPGVLGHEPGVARRSRRRGLGRAHPRRQLQADDADLQLLRW